MWWSHVMIPCDYPMWWSHVMIPCDDPMLWSHVTIPCVCSECTCQGATSQTSLTNSTWEKFGDQRKLKSIWWIFLLSNSSPSSRPKLGLGVDFVFPLSTYPRQPMQHILGNPCNISSATHPHLNLPLRTSYRLYLALSYQSYQTKLTKPNLLNQSYQTKPTKPNL